MKLLKKLLLGVFALCCAVGFAACGGGSGSKSSSESVQETCEMRGYHNYVAGKCDNCEKEVTPTEYFTFSEKTIDGKEGYEIGYKGEFINVILPDYYNKKAVLSIKEWAFEGCTSLTSVTIPEGVISIGEKAFSLCGSLMSITIPDSVTSIGDRAFEDCWSLASITIPEGVTSIEESAFEDCSSLTSVTIPDGVTSIGNYAFRSCTSLTSITIPDSVTLIEEGAFQCCSSLMSVTIPDGVTSIGDSVFEVCSGLMSVTIPDGVTSIGYRAFYECSSLMSVTIGNSVTSIGEDAFQGCDKLIIYCQSTSKPSDWDVDWNDGSLVVWNCNNNDVADDGYVYTISDGLRYTLKDGQATVVARQAENISSVNIPSTITYKSMFYPVTSIGSKVFYYCDSLTSITIPDSVTSIGNYAFSGCDSLTSIIIPDGVTSIGNSVFYECGGIIFYCQSTSKPSGWNENWNEGRPIVWDCNNNDVADDGYMYTISNGLRYALKDGQARVAARQAGNISSANIPSTITYKSMVYPVTSIEEKAFSTGGLASIVIPDSVTSIGDYAFGWCDNLTSITIPDNVTSIGYRAFCECSNLTSVTIGNSVTSIGNYAFSGCKNLTSITIPDSVTSIGNYAFSGCKKLTSLTIPDSVTSIGNGAFSNCWRVTTVTIGNSVTSIGEYAFDECSRLTTVYYHGTAEAWNKISKELGNTDLTSATRYYYRKTRPTESGNYWHYDEKGQIVVW